VFLQEERRAKQGLDDPRRAMGNRLLPGSMRKSSAQFHEHHSNGLITELEKSNLSKLVRFCGDPRGLSFYRIKGRGTVLQLEFDEQIYRTREGAW
jgi:hypothetical protein